jgi:hypothetical protein
MVRCESGAGGVLAACWQRAGNVPLVFLVVPGLEVTWFLDFPGRVFFCGNAGVRIVFDFAWRTYLLLGTLTKGCLVFPDDWTSRFLKFAFIHVSFISICRRPVGDSGWRVR